MHTGHHRRSATDPLREHLPPDQGRARCPPGYARGEAHWHHDGRGSTVACRPACSIAISSCSWRCLIETVAGLRADLAAPAVRAAHLDTMRAQRSEEHTSELQSLMRISYAVFCLKKKKK